MAFLKVTSVTSLRIHCWIARWQNFQNRSASSWWSNWQSVVARFAESSGSYFLRQRVVQWAVTSGRTLSGSASYAWGLAAMCSASSGYLTCGGWWRNLMYADASRNLGLAFRPAPRRRPCSLLTPHSLLLQLLQRNRATLCVSWNLVNWCTAVPYENSIWQGLLINLNDLEDHSRSSEMALFYRPYITIYDSGL